jgi:hypothetical protein
MSGPPTIISIDPDSGSVLDNVVITINGTNFDSTTLVFVNDIETTLVLNSDTSITITIESSHIIIMPVEIYVSNLGINSNSVNYTYLPDIKSICPREITKLNEHIVIHGVGLNENMSVYFNGITGQSVFKNHKVIYVETEPSLTNGPVNVTVDSCATTLSIIYNIGGTGYISDSCSESCSSSSSSDSSSSSSDSCSSDSDSSSDSCSCLSDSSLDSLSDSSDYSYDSDDESVLFSNLIAENNAFRLMHTSLIADKDNLMQTMTSLIADKDNLTQKMESVLADNDSIKQSLSNYINNNKTKVALINQVNFYKNNVLQLNGQMNSLRRNNAALIFQNNRIAQLYLALLKK